jgi:hypothetical protein
VRTALAWLLIAACALLVPFAYLLRGIHWFFCGVNTSPGTTYLIQPQ